MLHERTSQLASVDDPILAEIVRRLVQAFDPEQIYLFGSHARGEAGPDSDYDLMVVVPQSTEPGYRLAQQAHSLLWGLAVAADILVWTHEQFDSRRHAVASPPPPAPRTANLCRMIQPMPQTCRLD